ncbi:MAG: hypothetical protein RR415_02915, partial [Ruthenibacterium sp.]
FGGKRETRRSHSFSRRMARLAATHNIKEDGGTVKTVPYGCNLKIEWFSRGATRASFPTGAIYKLCVHAFDSSSKVKA